jgi:hypothetical protein
LCAGKKSYPSKNPNLIHHEPDNSHCPCGCALKRIGEDVSEKLDCTLGVFSIERHIRGKWVCGQCETLIQAPVPEQVIDKGIPTAGLLAHVMIAKFAGHLPLYRQESILVGPFWPSPARSGRKENPSRLCLGLRHQPVLGLGGGRLRLQPQSRRRARM